MHYLRFLVDRVDVSGIVIGTNVGDATDDIPVGSTFVAMGKEKFEGDWNNLRCVDLGILAAIRLTLTRVDFYGRAFDVAPGGHGAGLTLEGEGLETLKSAVASVGKREYVYMLAERCAGPSAP
jgi:hypothetical protein